MGGLLPLKLTTLLVATECSKQRSRALPGVGRSEPPQEGAGPDGQTCGSSAAGTGT